MLFARNSGIFHICYLHYLFTSLHIRKIKTKILLSFVLLGILSTGHTEIFTASNQQELYSAIEAAKLSSDEESLITLMDGFVISDPFPGVSSKNITIDTAVHSLSFSADSVFNIDTNGVLTLLGNIDGGDSIFDKNGNGELVLNVTGSDINRISSLEGDIVVSGGGELRIINPLSETNGIVNIGLLSNKVASLTVTGGGTRLLAEGPDGLDMSQGSGSNSTLTIREGAYFGIENAVRIHRTGYQNSTATLNIIGQGSLLETSAIGFFNGQSAVNLLDGGQLRSSGSSHLGGFYAGRMPDAEGIAVVSGQNSSWTSDTFYMYRGSLSILDGGVVSASTLNIGTRGFAVPHFDVLVSGQGSSLMANTMALGTTGTGVLTISNNGAVIVDEGASPFVLGGANANSNAILNIGGGVGNSPLLAGSLEASEVLLDSKARINFNHLEADYSFDTAITGAGAINQVAGRTIFTNDQTGFTGLTSVEGGVLEVNSILGGTMKVNGGRLHGSGSVGDVTHEAGAIIAPGNSIGTLTINGDYVGNGGEIEIESVLGDDNSATDLLSITGNTSGAAKVVVNNLEGAGAATQEGIRIISVGGVSDGSFTLQGDYEYEGEEAVVGGAYAYRLYKNDVSTNSDGDWYLRSSLLPNSEKQARPLYQAGAPVYEAMPRFLLELNRLPTLKQRVSSRYLSHYKDKVSTNKNTGEQANQLRHNAGLWARVVASNDRMSPKSSTSGTKLNSDLWKMQLGLDGKLPGISEGELIAGFTAHLGAASADMRSQYGNGAIDTNAYGVGTTLTLYQESGLYIDGQAQMSWFRNDLSSKTMSRNLANNVDGFGYSLGVETGFRYELNPKWSLVPQSQLTYTTVDFDNFEDVFEANVSLEKAESLKGRLGLEVGYGPEKNQYIYSITSLTYEFIDETSVSVSGTKFNSEDRRLGAEVGIGANYSDAEGKYQLYGEVLVSSSFSGEVSSTGTVGVMIPF